MADEAPEKRGWSTGQKWLAAIGALVSLVTGIVGFYFNALPRKDELRAALGSFEAVDFESDQYAKVVVNGHIMLANSGDGPVTLIGINLFVGQTSDDSIEGCYDDALLFSILPAPLTIKSGEMIIQELGIQGSGTDFKYPLDKQEDNYHVRLCLRFVFFTLDGVVSTTRTILNTKGKTIEQVRVTSRAMDPDLGVIFSQNRHWFAKLRGR
jgi:hypothetical protein